MPQAARITDAVAGTTAGEHTGHVPPTPRNRSAGRSPGRVRGRCRINGLAARYGGEH